MKCRAGLVPHALVALPSKLRAYYHATINAALDLDGRRVYLNAQLFTTTLKMPVLVLVPGAYA